MAENREVFLDIDTIEGLMEELGMSEGEIKFSGVGFAPNQNSVEEFGHTITWDVINLYPGISPTARHLYTIIKSYAWKVAGRWKNYAYPTQKSLGRYLGRSELQVSKYVKELEKAGLIRVYSRNRKVIKGKKGKDGEMIFSDKRASNLYILQGIPKEIVEWYRKNVKKEW